jgi:hypothetical protein
MSADERIQDVKALLDEINADDVAEDAAFQNQIDQLSTTVTALTAERDEAVSKLAEERVNLITLLNAFIAQLEQ